MSIEDRVIYLSALIKYDLRTRGEISDYIKTLVLEDFKLSQSEWDHLAETQKFVIQEATRRFSEAIEKESV